MLVVQRAFPVARSVVIAALAALGMIALSCTCADARADEAAVSPAPLVPAAEVTTEPVGQKSVVRSHFTDGFYGGPEVKLTAIDGDVSVLGGLSAGWVLAKTVAFGVAGYTTFGAVKADDASEALRRTARTTLAYGGVRVGGFVFPRGSLRLAYGILVGGAGAGLTIEGDRHRTELAPVVEPDVALQWQFARGMRLTLSASYRFVTNAVHEDVGDIGMSAPSGSLGVSFGDF